MWQWKASLERNILPRDELCILELLTIKHIKFKRQGRRTSPKRSKHKEPNRKQELLHKIIEEDLGWVCRGLSSRADSDVLLPTPPCSDRGEHYPSARHDSLGENTVHSHVIQIVTSPCKKSCWSFTSSFSTNQHHPVHSMMSWPSIEPSFLFSVNFPSPSIPPKS